MAAPGSKPQLPGESATLACGRGLAAVVERGAPMHRLPARDNQGMEKLARRHEERR